MEWISVDDDTPSTARKVPIYVVSDVDSTYADMGAGYYSGLSWHTYLPLWTFPWRVTHWLDIGPPAATATATD